MSHGKPGRTYPTPPAAKDRRVIGHPVTRIEDRPLVTGHGRYAGDINFDHQLHMRIVRAPVAHAKINGIDASAALALPGVVAVWTNADIATLSPIDFRADKSAESLKAYRQPALAKGRVRYVGDPVAAVFAEDPYLAEDAAELVQLDLEELPVIVSASDKPGTFDDGLHTEAGLFTHTFGDVEAAFKTAPHIIELDLVTGRHSGVPMETRGAIGRYDAARDLLELHGAAKIPHRNRETLCRMLDRSPSALHVFESHVGGGFGIRGEIYPEDVLVLLAAVRLGRPVKWIEDRREHLMCANQGREQRHIASIAFDDNGIILGMRDEIFHDQGAYVRTHGANVPNRTMCMLTGPYKVPAYAAIAHFRLTNKTPAATYRAPGRYESSFVRERLIDAIGHKLGIDPNDVRRRNAITPAEMPYARPLEALGEEIEYDSGDYIGLLDKALAAARWTELQASLARRRAQGEAVGAGLALFVEKSGLGPTDGVRITVDTGGLVEVVTGGASIGQGIETVVAQICAETLGVDYRRIRVVHGRTDQIEHGIGAHASRATVMTGSATHAAALKLRDKAIDIAAELMQTSKDALDIIDGKVVRRDAPAGSSMALGDIARHLAPGSKTRGEREPGLSVTGWFTTDHQVYPYGVHIAVVCVDRDTGAVAVEKYLAAYDIGRAVNPALVR
ncbi:MAG TPA: xanthine dehydrogenase family protein molybdopterin-binding subunit, partial [Xanthobacteraceae bacterium]|nr:xanthine dehydrogenase family protein molybdopterin-binding subunit [Xanthobacteraceae bacterium]